MKKVTSFLSGEAVLLKNLMSRHRSFGKLLAIAFLSLSTTVFAGEDASLVRYGQDPESGDVRVAKRGDRKMYSERKRLLRSQQSIDQNAAMNERRADRERTKKYYQKKENIKPRIKREYSSPGVSARMSLMHRERNMHQGKVTPRPVRPIDESERHFIRMPHQVDKIEQKNKEENTEFTALPVIRPDGQEELVVPQGPLAAPEDYPALPVKQQEDEISPADSEQASAEEKNESGEPETQVMPEPAAPVLVSEESEKEQASSSMTEEEKRERLNELEAQLADKRRALNQIDSSDTFAYQMGGYYDDEQALNKDIAQIEAEIKSLR